MALLCLIVLKFCSKSFVMASALYIGMGVAAAAFFVRPPYLRLFPETPRCLFKQPSHTLPSVAYRLQTKDADDQFRAAQVSSPFAAAQAAPTPSAVHSIRAVSNRR